MLYQQGDVLLKKIDQLPNDIVKENTKNGNWIVAEGEFTGHFHGIAEKEAIVYEKEGKKYILTENGFTITHQEHNPITVLPGIYEVGIVREYDPLDETIRSVKD
jgi:hypothetical protein